MKLPGFGSISLTSISMFHLLALSLKVLIAYISSVCSLRAQGSLPNNCYLAIQLIVLEVSYTNLSLSNLSKLLLLLDITVPGLQMVQGRICLPTQETQEMGIRSLGGEDSLEEEMATHSSTLVCRILVL